MTRLTDCLPADWRSATLAGRIALPEGPAPVMIRNGRVYDMSAIAPTSADLLAQLDRTGVSGGRDLGAAEALNIATVWGEDAPGALTLLAPVDLQTVKAAGVTFAVSTIERVIEERAGGDLARARDIRDTLQTRMGGDLASVKPGSEKAARLKAALIADGLWSQYLEVAIGPDAEVFTKCPVLASVGHGGHVGVRSDSQWNNPEPEIVMVCNPEGEAVGAMLGNDVNLRDFEGRSALLLGKAKDNNASCALGPFIRLFDDGFTLDDVRSATVALRVEGEDGFVLTGESSMRLISRDPLDLIGQTFGEHHQYPDGMALFLGTMFAPIEDRDAPGRGFTHKRGDRVRVSSERLGVLENLVEHCDNAPPWTFGISALMRNLAARGLLEAT
ncbi:fumarylacetoacetate hydrolase family protein [Alkalicaulis satelles]|uniref:Fumarylacetoacetate hydrolase family protein n=1 Tax=Alkalicaulis satelles TaxID=2609175 RepID=A0A5M6ZN87_9PROT|nr:fumarylacetoacetate hydrolase family protein [Alkalicaulis satelles]KAA5805054.1 fumarylacetoacetate hydrolase family protein [Alkalicaulis satelles]